MALVTDILVFVSVSIALDGTHGYWLSSEKLSWSKANASCLLAKPDMTSIKPELLKEMRAGEVVWLGYTDSTYEPVCPSKWLYNPNTKSCYRVFINNTIDFFDATSACVRRDSRLTNIEDRSEQYFLTELIISQTQFEGYWDSLWTAGVSTADKGWVWDMYDTKVSQQLKWIDDNLPDPDYFNQMEACVVLVAADTNNFYGILDHFSCYSAPSSKGYICKQTDVGEPVRMTYGYIQNYGNTVSSVLYENDQSVRRRFLCESELTDGVPRDITTLSSGTDTMEQNNNQSAESGVEAWALFIAGFCAMVPVVALSMFVTFKMTQKRFSSQSTNDASEHDQQSNYHNSETSVARNGKQTNNTIINNRLYDAAGKGKLNNNNQTPSVQTNTYTALVPPRRDETGHMYCDLKQNEGVKINSYLELSASANDDAYYSSCS